MIAIGLMSGTSMDGIDAALIDSDGCSYIKKIGYYSYRYEKNFIILMKAAEYTLSSLQGNLTLSKEMFLDYLKIFLQENKLNISQSDLLQYLENEINYYLDKFKITNSYNNIIDKLIDLSTFLHIEIINELIQRFPKIKVDIIGYHGQTLYHNAQAKITIQVGNPGLMYNITKINIIYEFRKNDIINGGQGAPLVPFYHKFLLSTKNISSAIVVNCGGIANLSIISQDNLFGFDSGPGNCLIDQYVRLKTDGRENMDKDGFYGLQGKLNEEIISLLMQNTNKNYYNLMPPKSLDYRDIKLIDEVKSLNIYDGCATLAAFTAKTIVESTEFIESKKIPKNWFLCGGGWNNPVITNFLKLFLSEKFDYFKIEKLNNETDDDYTEPEAFAFFAICYLKKIPVTFPSTTGTKLPTIAGTKFPHK